MPSASLSSTPPNTPASNLTAAPPSPSPIKPPPPRSQKPHRLEKSRSQRILWLLEELQLTYSLQTYKRENMLAPPSLKQVHPLGKSPLVSVESAANPSAPLVLAESSFIVEYLTDHFGPWLAPARYAGAGKTGEEGEVGGETESWVRYRYFMHYAEGSLMPFLVIALLLSSKSGRSSAQPPSLFPPPSALRTSAKQKREGGRGKSQFDSS